MSTLYPTGFRAAQPHGALVAVVGQSLALGYGVRPSELPAAYQPSPLIQILVGDHVEMMAPGLNTGTPNNPEAWGPEVGIAMTWELMHPGVPLTIVKVAIGSTFLAAQDGALDWSPESTGELFDRTTAAVATAKSLTGLDLSDVYFVQGQQDATTAATADAYGANLADFLDQARAAWGTPATNFIIAEVSDTSGLPYATAVRSGEASAVAQDPRAVLISDLGLTYQADDLHLTGAGEVTLGERMASAVDARDARVPPAASLHWFLPSFGHGLIPEGWVFELAAVVASAAWAAEFIQRSIL